jgi:hypothetical protein
VKLSSALAMAAFSALIGCGKPQPTPIAPDPQSAQRSDAAAATPTVVRSDCVLHAGQVYVERSRSRGPGAQQGPEVQTSRCSFNAECIAEQGQVTDGDGDVYLACAEDDCSCRIVPLTPAREAVEFQFRAECVTDIQAKQLLVERCMKGMHVVPERPSPDG